MRNSTSRQPAARFFAGLIFLSALLAAAGWLDARLAAQDKPKPSKKEEEEDPAAKPKRPVPVVGDEEREEKPAKPKAKPEDTQVADLEREADRATNPVVKELYSSLARPHDVLTTPRGRAHLIEPIPEYIGSKPSFSGKLTVQLLNDQGKRSRPAKYEKRDLLAVDPYENIALNKVNDFLKSGLDQEPDTSVKFLSRRDMLQEAEKVLVAVIKFHESARERGLREGEAWKGVAKKLQTRLREIQLDKLRSLTDAKDWDTAFDLALRLKENYREDQQVQKGVAELLAQHALKSLHAQDYRATRQRLLLIEREFQAGAVADSVRDGLRSKASELMKQAQKLADSDAQGAIALLQIAESIYPQLPGLRDYNLQLNQKYPIVYIGVHDLPEKNLSPATAYTDSEKQAVELQFESLVKLASVRAVGQRYEANLAEELPQLVPLGRRFQLLRNAYWSNGKPVTGVDVRQTVDLLRKPDFPGRIPEWADLMEEGARLEGDPFHVTFTLRQGYLDPLSMMDFKILPQLPTLTRADDANFAENPIGSGPYKYDPEKSKPGEEIVFVANPYYEARPGKFGLPRIREIHFVVSKNPVEDFQLGRLHLLLDLPTRKLRESMPGAKVQTLKNRRINFLAINHRNSVLGSSNGNLRRAIALAINREEILNKMFRYGFASHHRVLNGPYPPGSWAYTNKPDDLKPDPFNLKLAKALAAKAKLERGTLPKLRLIYPDGDPDVAGACKMIQDQVQAPEVGIELELKPVPLRELRRLVEENHDYDLAYYHWDYSNEAYWLWPLFDPSADGPGGRNFLGYKNDGPLASLFRETMTRREMKEIQKLTHQIHADLYEKMPFIPLWQLDTHYAIHDSLKLPGPIDPLLIFTDVDKWEKR